MVTVVIENVPYEIPAAVEAQMRLYYDTMTKLVELNKKITGEIQEVAHLDTVSRKRGATKEDRLRAWEAKKILLNQYK